MKLTVEEFRAWSHKSITLLGMSGVGKTRISKLLRQHDWFHYSGDYRIGTRYLDEAILDNIKTQAMQVPFLRDLLRSDSIQIRNNITIDNIHPVSSFLGKIGNPEKSGLDYPEFMRRQALHHDAEIETMKDVPEFIEKAQLIYGYCNFINDAGGSVCELDDPQVLEILAQHTLLLYIQASHEDEAHLIERAEKSPKPLYYRKAFFDEQLKVYMDLHNIDYVALIDPDDFVRWIFPKLFYARIPRYEKIANKYGYTITTEELAQVRCENDFIALIETALQRDNKVSKSQVG